MNRREFLRTAAPAAAGAALAGCRIVPPQSWKAVPAEKLRRGAVVIERIQAFRLRYDVTGHFKFFQSVPGVPYGRPAVLVKITASNGAVGWGQSVPSHRWSYETLESAATTIETYLAPELIGQDPLDILGAHTAMNRVIAAGFSTGMPIAKAGIDLALHDLTGKIAGKPLAHLWGRPAGGRITLSWTLNPKTPGDTDAAIEEGWKRGYRNFNVKIAPDLEADLALCRKVKARVPDGFLWADANGGYDLETALAAAPKLAEAGVSVFEQPLPANRITGCQRLKKQGALPIILDEGVVAFEDLVEFHKLGMMDGVAMKPARCGGLLAARKMVDYLRENGLIFLGSGLTDPDVSLAASLILYASAGLDRPAALNGPQYLAGSVLRRPLAPDADGTIAVPEGFGLGVEVDESKIRALSADRKTN